MESQDSPTVIPCSEELSSVAEDESDAVVMVPSSDPASIQQTANDSSQTSQSQSLLAELYDNGNNQNENISSINVSEIKRTKFASVNSSSGVGRNSASNSIVDMESSEINPMSSTRIEQDNSMSLLNEGFMIDSASLSLSAVNEDNLLDNTEKTTTDSNENDEAELESIEIEAETEENDEIMDMEDESEEVPQVSKSSKRKESAVESDEGEVDENATDYPTPPFPMAKVKRIMAICAAAEDDEEPDNTKTKSKNEKGKGNMLITKEAIYLTSLATEHFITVIGKMAGNVTASSKKKTLTLEHLKRAVSDTDAFAFLEGCFQPSVIIGD